MVNIIHQRVFLDGEWDPNKMRMGAFGSMRLQDINKEVVKKYRTLRVSRIWCSRMRITILAC